MIKTGRYDFLAQDSVLFGTPCFAAVMLSVFKWCETDGLISPRRDWLIDLKV